ncbi:MAG: hypothetical protein M3Y84_07085 [Acidobacteriota bacterium]|nr:hypothetical protein [Acidobacteriota bacterium]
MNLVRDCLDTQVVDRNDCNMGKCDGIVMNTEGAGQPEITHIEIGTVTLARRVHPRFGRWVEALAKRWGVADRDPFRVPWSKVVVTGVTVTVGVDAEETSALAWERWLRRNVIGRIPGA